jgi:hypothetical protein
VGLLRAGWARWAARGRGELGRRLGRAGEGAAGPLSQPAQGERGKEGGGWACQRAGPREKGAPFYFPFSLSFVLSYFLHGVKLNSLLNPCSTKSLIKQSESIRQHDATIKALIGF